MELGITWYLGSITSLDMETQKSFPYKEETTLKTNATKNSHFREIQNTHFNPATIKITLALDQMKKSPRFTTATVNTTFKTKSWRCVYNRG